MARADGPSASLTAGSFASWAHPACCRLGSEAELDGGADIGEVDAACEGLGHGVWFRFLRAHCHGEVRVARMGMINRLVEQTRILLKFLG